jgi:phosphoadenosine phosphosulfate reductase
MALVTIDEDLVRVEAAQRAYEELNIRAVTLEADATGLHKLNPFSAWKFTQVEEYLKANNVPRNKLLDEGYKSVDD